MHLKDDDILALFFARSEEAIACLSAKYGRLCGKLAMNILGDMRDAEECVNDAYLAAWKNIPPERPINLQAYICRIVRNISIARWKYKQAEKRKTDYGICLEELENSLFSSGEIDEKLSEKELAGYLVKFLDTLDVENRRIFVRRFWYAEPYREIAKATGMRESSLRIRMLRVKKKLKVFLEERGVIV